MADDFAEIVREHEAMVFRTLARMLGSQEHVADLAQEVFLRLYRALPHFERRARLSTYVYRIVVNVAQDEWKRRSRPANRALSLSDPASGWEHRLPHPGPAPDTTIEHRQVWAFVQASLPHLSEPERAALVLYHQEELSYEEIARVLEMPIGSIRTHLHRGREKLARMVRERIAGHGL